MRSAPSKWGRLIGFLLIVGGAVMALKACGVSWSDVTPERVRALVLSWGWWAPLIFFLLYAQPFIPLPASVMYAAGGLSFGLAGGFAIVWLTAVTRAMGQFFLAKLCGREAVETLLRGHLAAIDQRVGRNGLLTVLWIRLTPNVPFDVQNFGLGLSSVPAGPFLLATCLGILPGVGLFVYIGHAMTDLADLWTVLAILIGLAAGGFLYTRVRREGGGKRAPAAMPPG